MNAPSSRPLFRQEVLESRTERLDGEVNLAVPVGWQVIGFTLLAALAAALVFLATASYGRVETVSGNVVLDRGVVPIIPSRPGIVFAIHVREGQAVAPGTALVQVRAEEDLAGGTTMSARMRQALEQQDAFLSAQSESVLRTGAAERGRLAEQMAGLTRELASVREQIVSQQRLVQVAETSLRELQSLAGKGFISRRDIEARESTVLTRRQQLAQLQQTQSALAADLAEARRAIAESAASADAQAAAVQSNRAALAQEVAQNEAAQGYTLTAPVAGTVTALTARPGQPAAAGQPLLVVMPADARPDAELYVPTSAAGFLAPGQEVRLAVDAFPYQRFGTVRARIVSISSVTVPRAGPDGRVVPVYLVTARLENPYVTASGRRQPLLPGMTLTARITTDRRSLLHWLFEPIFAVRDR